MCKSRILHNKSPLSSLERKNIHLISWTELMETTLNFNLTNRTDRSLLQCNQMHSIPPSYQRLSEASSLQCVFCSLQSSVQPPPCVTFSGISLKSRCRLRSESRTSCLRWQEVFSQPPAAPLYDSFFCICRLQTGGWELAAQTNLLFAHIKLK